MLYKYALKTTKIAKKIKNGSQHFFKCMILFYEVIH
jgi:hypothetical protein